MDFLMMRVYGFKPLTMFIKSSVSDAMGVMDASLITFIKRQISYFFVDYINTK